jgi:small-conductance mechanosensitive channel
MEQGLVFQTGVGTFVDQLLADIVAVTPRVAGALLILLVGWIVGRVLGGVVRRVVDRLEIDRQVLKTPLGGALGGTEKAVSRSTGRVAAYFVYALAILAAADTLAIDLLSVWIADAVSYLPAFVAGALIIVLGFVLADFLGDVVANTESMTETGYTDLFANGLRVFLYFVVTVIGLGTMGVDVQILNTFATAIAIGLGVGIALALGLGIGLGSRDYVGENIGRWISRGSEVDIEPQSVERERGEDVDVSPGDD